ncbi:glycosyltransferase [Arthrobacter sp. NPDC090010]|uniref:glycosyltransferase n=1 Tax=Arthrobacter sp. NPDC090010 TaxID=3363942 RepID=UPI0037FB5DF7
MSGLIVHEWIESSGGAEKVLESMASAFPDAAIQCLWNDAPGRFGTREIRETWLAGTPLRRKKAMALPFMVPTWRLLESKGPHDWTLVSSHLFAHHVRFRDQPDSAPKYVYAHTPARYIWTPELDHRGSSPAVRAVAPLLKKIDRRRAQEPTAIAANSKFVRERIAATWEREASVIYPPVAVERVQQVADWRSEVTDPEEVVALERLPQEFVLGVSRFIPYKRLDLVLATGAAAGLPVVIAGKGPEEEHLRMLASQSSVPVHFIIAPSDALLFSLYQMAKALVFPAVEDFGIVPVEAQAAGTPVVTGPIGGQLESLTQGVTGVVAASTDVVDLAAALDDALRLAPFDGVLATSRFATTRFEDELRAFVA